MAATLGLRLLLTLLVLLCINECLVNFVRELPIPHIYLVHVAVDLLQHLPDSHLIVLFFLLELLKLCFLILKGSLDTLLRLFFEHLIPDSLVFE